MTGSSSDNYFHRLCESLGFICIGVDPDLTVRFWNRQAAQQFGRSSEDMRGRSILEVIEEPEQERAQQLFHYALATRTVGEMEIKYHSGRSDQATFVLIVSPILNEQGCSVGASASMRDISQRKRLSQDLARSRRMASLGKMAGGVAHHFNNILGGMLTSIDYVLPSDSPRELRRTLRLLAQAIGRATRITRQLSAFAESETELHEWSELNPLIAGFCEKMQRQAAAAGIKLVTDIRPVDPCQFEVQRLMPVLDSIAQNALDAITVDGTLTIEMSQDGQEAVIAISDSGCGMSEEELDHLFEPFYTTKGELGGGSSDNIGLGLAAVHGLVSEMGGTINISSHVGQGTRVVIRLPLQRESAGPTRPDAAFGDPPGGVLKISETDS